MSNTITAPTRADADYVQAMTALGAAPCPLSADALQRLDQDGYLVLPGVIEPSWRAALAERFDQLVASDVPVSGAKGHLETNTARLFDLVNRGPLFDAVWTHPVVLAAVAHILGRPFKLSSLNGREGLAGGGHQDLHVDWGGREVDQPYHVVNALWLLDDYTADNGATRLIPGSHRLRGEPRDHLADPSAPHPDEVILLAPAGTVVVVNAHCWHGGTVNRSGDRRRVLHSYYTAREYSQQFDQREFIRHGTWQRLAPEARWLLDA